MSLITLFELFLSVWLLQTGYSCNLKRADKEDMLMQVESNTLLKDSRQAIPSPARVPRK